MGDIKLPGDKIAIFVMLITAFFFVIIGSIWFSHSAETLDIVAENFGASESTLWSPPIPDYEIRGLEENSILNIFIGITSSLLVFGVTFMFLQSWRNKKRR